MRGGEPGPGNRRRCGDCSDGGWLRRGEPRYAGRRAKTDILASVSDPGDVDDQSTTTLPHQSKPSRATRRQPMTTADTDWADARAAMLLDRAVANLNTGSFGPTPRSVFDRVTALRRRLAEEPMAFLLREAPPLLWRARERLAAFVGTVPTRLVFTANVTAAINIVAAGLRLS